MEPIKRWETIELKIPAGTKGRVQFDASVQQLANQPDQIIVVKNIRVYPITSYANSQTSNAIPGMPVADIKKAALVLYVNGEESIKLIPLVELISVNDLASPFMDGEPGFADLTNVDFQQSYVQFSSASDAATYVIPFGVSYVRLTKNAAGAANSSWQAG